MHTDSDLFTEQDALGDSLSVIATMVAVIRLRLLQMEAHRQKCSVLEESITHVLLALDPTGEHLKTLTEEST